MFHWISCIWLYFTKDPDISNYSNYIRSLYWTITTLTTVGYGDVTPQTDASKIFTMFVMLMGVAFYGGILGFISKLILSSDKHKEANKEKLNDLMLFMKHYQVPDNLQKETYNYFSYLINKKLTANEDEIIKDLPSSLRGELNLYVLIQLINDISFVKNISLDGKKSFCRALKLQFYSPGQLIIKKDAIGEEFFIIGHGEVHILSDDHEKIATLIKGQCFGEIALLKNVVRTANVMATSYCEVYVLHKNDFDDLTKKYPTLKKNLEAIMQERN